MEDLIGEWDASSDDGERFTILEYQTKILHQPVSGPSRWLGGAKRLVLSDGRAVNWIDAETFKIVDTDQIIRKV